MQFRVDMQHVKLILLMEILVNIALCIMSKICLSSYQYLARSQERQICAKLANKGYEPSWKTLEVETLEDWWGLMLVRQYPVGTFLDGKYLYLFKLFIFFILLFFCQLKWWVVNGSGQDQEIQHLNPLT